MGTNEFAITDRNRVTRLAKRANYDCATVFAIIDEAMICHVAVGDATGPRVIPMFHARIGATLYLHGSRGSPLLLALGRGAAASVAFTLLDGLVLARSAFHHSMNYRSVVMFGCGREVTDRGEKDAAFRALVEHVAPGRWEQSRPPNEQEWNGTLVVSIPIDEASAKIRKGPPMDDAADMGLPFWAGVIPLQLTSGAAIASPDLRPGVEKSSSVVACAEKFMASHYV